MITSIIFDVGGVLMTDVPLRKIARDLSTRFSVPEDELHSHLYPTGHWTLLTLGEISEGDYWDHFLKNAKIDLDKKELRDRVRTELRPIAQNARIIPLLRGRYRLAVLSNHSREWSEFMRGEFDFFDCFDQIIFSCDVGLRKPDPRIYRLALARLGSDPEECLFVDDKKRNTDAAREAGMKTITLENASDLREQLLGFGLKLDQQGG
jgi:epoxide hydrolase-like predicted phosphatase